MNVTEFKDMIDAYEKDLYDLKQDILYYKNEFENNKINLLRIKTAELLTKKHNFTISITDLEFFAWPQSSGCTALNGCGGNSMSSFTVICFRNIIHNDCVLWVGNSFQYNKIFEPFITFKN